MPRPPRSFVEGIYHVAAHGSDTRRLFLSSRDRTAFLQRLALVVERFKLGLVAYALLGTHYHAVFTTPGGGISNALQQLHTWYSRLHNHHRRRNAHLFRAHFFARELVSDSDVLVTCRYLAYNPVAAGLCADPFAWPWASTAASAGLAEAAVPLDHAPLRAALGDGDDWPLRYRGFIEASDA